MKAARIHAYGEADQIRVEEAPMPVPGAGDVLVRGVAASVNPVDWKIRKGYLKTMIPYDLPLTLGWDVSGVVAAVGPGVTQWKAGDAVYSRPDIRRQGTYAEFVVVRADELAAKPATISHVEAASLPLVSITAWEALFTTAGLEAGQRVLIHAGAGGVGSIAVQLAKAKGAHVIATASKGKAGLVRSLGADEVLDLREAGAVHPDGRRAGFVFIGPNAAILRDLAGMVDAGQVRPVIGAEFGLDHAAEAQRLSEAGRVTGKIVIYTGQP